jgi:adiponectin receptor
MKKTKYRYILHIGPCRAAEQAEEFVKRVWEAGWRVVHHHHLPDWLQDNSFLHKGHRMPTNSFRECFKSIFRIHTETGNIWTHLLGKILMEFPGKAV